ncbi:GNAT family N-acetyltransferase [Ponticoccus alexandrii]|uniref:N-acetyltransferase n=1 Tax=Ponticoccus alexandrii TaxID=1943633 RepID=A0ABX7FCE6_9RHOB|nr:GNAT family N-acetyltransferase [Ponticoccus alexandrii]ETA53866.1 hypothetical protein P279_00855 [Rhodobacteraceae bacterium PD-2]QRF67239.1 N-acetyltransferase [Ponticoccus alexandrii]
MIEPCDDRDIPTLVQMLRQLNGLHASHVPARFHDDGADAALRGVFDRALEQGDRVLVYRTEGLARGYLLWRPLPEGQAALERCRRIAVLDQLFVDPVWRRRGLAGRLVARFERDIGAEGFSGWISRVHAFNRASGTLMRKTGAEVGVQVFEKTL